MQRKSKIIVKIGTAMPCMYMFVTILTYMINMFFVIDAFWMLRYAKLSFLGIVIVIFVIKIIAMKIAIVMQRILFDVNRYNKIYTFCTN